MLAIYLTLIDNEDDKKSFEDLYNQNRSKLMRLRLIF